MPRARRSRNSGRGSRLGCGRNSMWSRHRSCSRLDLGAHLRSCNTSRSRSLSRDGSNRRRRDYGSTLNLRLSARCRWSGRVYRWLRDNRTSRRLGSNRRNSGRRSNNDPWFLSRLRNNPARSWRRRCSLDRWSGPLCWSGRRCNYGSGSRRRSRSRRRR